MRIRVLLMFLLPLLFLLLTILTILRYICRRRGNCHKDQEQQGAEGLLSVHGSSSLRG